MPKMQTSFSGLVQLLAKNLYASAEVFIRELIQNAHDGCQRRLLAEPSFHPRIEITTSLPDRTISFLDNGIGMDESDIHEYLSTIGRSGTATEGAKLAASGFSPATIGQFGVGLLSAFVVAKRIDVFTRKRGAPSGYHWVSHGGDEYQVTPTTDAPECGTEITVTLDEQYDHFLREEELLRVIRLYADFIGMPILLNQQGPVNMRHAPWHASGWTSAAEREEACRRFLQRRFSDHPLLIIPVEIAEPRTRGVLYITDQPMPGVGANGTVDIYVHRMCIRLKDAELLPEWATFVRGVIDTDLQPTASRDNLQRDGSYQRLRRALGETIVNALLDLQRTQPDYFRRICEWHHVGIKGMALRDDAFFSRVAPHLPFNTNAGSLPLREYLDRQRVLPGGRKPIYFFAFDGDETQFFQICSANGLLAINAGRFFDEPVLQKYADMNQEVVEMRRMDHLNSKQLYAEAEPGTAAVFAPLVAAMSAALEAHGIANVHPSLRDFAPDVLACVLLEHPGFEALDRIEALLNSPFVGGSVQSIAAELAGRIGNKPLELLLNVRNPLLQSLLARPDLTDRESQTLLMGLYHLALLNSQRRTRSETARSIDGYLQSRLGDIVRLRAEADELGRQVAALHRCTAAGAAPTADDWIRVMRGLTGATPEDFRRRVSASSDEEIGRLVLAISRCGGGHGGAS